MARWRTRSATRRERFAADKIAPIAAEIDEKDRFPRELWPQMGELGLHGITVEEEWGGLGLGYLEHVVAQEEVARASASVGLSYGAHSNLCVNQIRRWANDEQKTKYLPKLISGEHVGALAMSEAGAGSDVVGDEAARPRNRATAIASTAPNSGSPTAPMPTRWWSMPRPGRGGQPRHHHLPHRKGHGRLLDRPEGRQDGHARVSPTAELVFDDCFVPAENIMGPENGGVGVLMSGLDYERTVLAGIQLGIMQACLDVVMPYVRERKQFGKPIGSFQLMQAKVADMYVALNSARAYVYQVAKTCDAGQDHAVRRGGRDPAGERERGQGRRRGGPGAGRRRLHQGLAGRALHARRQAARHRRGDQRDPPDADRAGADRGVGKLC